jgi:hypothetical protein
MLCESTAHRAATAYWQEDIMRQQTTRFMILMASIATVVTLWPGTADAQRRHPLKPAGVVFVGGYFYDPFLGPYPWWPLNAYSFAYYPIDDDRALVRVHVTPKEATVYVDGFYAGIAGDFDGSLRPLPLPPGTHDIVLYLEGYRTVQTRAYLAPGSTVELHETMECLPPGGRSEPPAVAPPFPPPSAGSFMPPRTPRPGWAPPPPPRLEGTPGTVY